MSLIDPARGEPSGGRPSPETLTGTSPTSRLLYLDSLRGVLMLLGIVIHTSARWGSYREQLGGGWEGWNWLGQFIHLWRMPAFFLIAGFFATWVLSRRTVWEWWRRRLLRLALPLAFGMVVVNSFLWPAKSWVKGEVDQETFVETFTGTALDNMGRLGHLWFLAHLLVYCTVLALLTWVVRRWRRRPHLRAAAASWAARPGVALVAIAVLTLACGWAVQQAAVVSIGVDGARLKSIFVPYAAAFVFGAVLGLAPHALARVVDEATRWMLAPALVLPPLLVGPFAAFTPGSFVRSCAVVLAGLAWTFVLMGLFKRHLDRGGWLTRYVVDASLPVYLVHPPVLFALSGLLGGTGIDPITGGLVTIALTAVGSFLIYELLNRTPLTRWASTGRGERGASLLDLARPRGN